MSREKNMSSDGYTTRCGMQCSNRSDLPPRVGMNPRRFPEAGHSHGCVTDCLITVLDDHQLNGEVEIPIAVTTNTTVDTQKESTPPPEKVSPFCEQLISARHGIDSNVRRHLTPSTVLQRPSMWDHDMLRTKRMSARWMLKRTQLGIRRGFGNCMTHNY